MVRSSRRWSVSDLACHLRHRVHDGRGVRAPDLVLGAVDDPMGPLAHLRGEVLAADESAKQISDAGKLPDVPVVVLTAGVASMLLAVIGGLAPWGGQMSCADRCRGGAPGPVSTCRGPVPLSRGREDDRLTERGLLRQRTRRPTAQASAYAHA